MNNEEIEAAQNHFIKCFNIECNHDKVYAGYILTTDPYQRPWICKKCGIRGLEVECKEKTYEDISKKFRD